MTRSLVAFLAFTLTVSATAASPVPVGPLPDLIRPAPAVDLADDATSNGESTLVVWTYVICPCRQGDSIDARLLDSAHDRNAFNLGSGSGARVATNGTDYLVAWSLAGSRFQTEPYDNVKAQLITSRGELSTSRILNRSVSGGARAVAWNGTHWLAGYQSNEKALVAVLDGSLDRTATLDLGAATLVDLVQAGGVWWAVTHSQGVTAAIEIHASGDAGTRFVVGTADSSEAVITANGTNALLFFQNGPDIRVATFTPASGFSEPKVLLTSQQLIDAARWQSDVLLVHSDPATFSVRGSVVAMSGSIAETATLFESTPGSGIRLAEGNDGLLLLHSTSSTPSRPDLVDLFVYPVTSLAPLDPGTRRLVSQGNIAYQATPVIESTGAAAVALWSQTVGETGGRALFSRIIDGTGAPVGEPFQLPVVLDFASSLASTFNGERVLVVWSAGTEVRSVAISSDGRSATTPSVLGTGTSGDVAAGPNGTFAVWLGLDGKVMGTPLRSDGAPDVPGGFGILPTLAGFQASPRIATIDGGFVILWSEAGGVKSVTISPAGNVQSSTEPSPTLANGIVVAAGQTSMLAAWVDEQGSTLFAFSGDARPFERFDPHWGAQWSPLAIVPLTADRYLVAISRKDFVYTSIVSMEGAFITGITPLRILGPYPATEAGITTLDDQPVVLFTKERLVYVASGPPATRQRSANR